ncbi:MAG: protein TonB [Akkermansiaceae bacterium]|jgi:protein TonB
MHKAPPLQTRISGYGKRLSASFVVAVLGTGAVCGALALIIHAHQVFAEPPVHPENLTMHYVAPAKKVKSQVDSAPLRLITTPSGPAFALFQPPVPSDNPPKFVEVPLTPEVPSDLLVLEELDSENPFEVKAKPPEPKKTPKSTAVAKNTIPMKRSGPSQAELAQREAQRRASLAKKITQQASVLSRGTPSYPRSARTKGLQGQVVVTVTVGISGKVSSCQISKSSGHSSLDQSAVSAARRYRFRPAKNGLGQTVSVKKAIPFNFQLNS